MIFFSFAVSFFLLLTGAYFTLSLRLFSPLRFPKISASFMKKKRGDGITPFRALSLALAGTLGVGNIVGVSSAILTGGPGAIFWMWIGGIVATSLKYAEIVLAVKYRRHVDGGYVGGAGFYMTPFFASVFTLLTVTASFTIGNLLQMKTLSETLSGAFGVPPILSGIFAAVLLLLLLFGGTKKISDATGFLVPLASAIYTAMCLAVIISFRQNFGQALRLILSDAFSGGAAAGGCLGFFTNRALHTGITRGLVTNEAGAGTAPAAHACTMLENPCEQGFYGVFEVFADTLVLCSLTAFSLLCVRPDGYGKSEMEYVLACFEPVFGSKTGILIGVSIFLFAISTLIGWAHYGISSLSLLSDGKKSKRAYVFTYALLAICGAILESSIVWKLADLSIGIMTLINLSFLILHKKEIRSETDLYFKRRGR